MALVYYTVIGDRDDPAHPNAFPLDKPLDSILVGDIAECFPLAGEFHFRFKIKYDAFGFVWLDLQDYNRKVPICEGKISMRVLPVGASSRPGKPAKRPQAPSRAQPAPPQQRGAAPAASAQQNNSQQDILSGLASQQPIQRSHTAPVHARNDSADELIGMMTSAPPPAAAPNLFDMQTDQVARPRSGTNDLLDLVGDQPASF
eukprot:TRINITY_DN19993_c0_g1_i3.p1 TRINITY_DN19993_c0_g1~~TRINITY_DN19993_c0_g1_i3.p1  ORF type:complete len:202 (+),score=30.20 TRINITY_DN19993_c0_g1_i3:36-641(+)